MAAVPRPVALPAVFPEAAVAAMVAAVAAVAAVPLEAEAAAGPAEADTLAASDAVVAGHTEGALTAGEEKAVACRLVNAPTILC